MWPTRFLTRTATLIASSSVLFCIGCIDYFISQSKPCGGTRQVDAHVTLPDTGLGARGAGSVGFSESEAGRNLDETALYVWIFPPTGTVFADNAPDVRIVTDDGQVLMNERSGVAYQGSWSVRRGIRDEALRATIIRAFQEGRVSVEFSTTQPVPRLTRVRPTVRFAGKAPVLQCS